MKITFPENNLSFSLRDVLLLLTDHLCNQEIADSYTSLETL
jgi:hypothetical protein